MNGLFDNTKLAAYFLWEHTGCQNALDLWLCAEDMACTFEQLGILDPARVEGILKLDMYSLGYIEFVRHVAYCIYQYTGNPAEWHNWFAAERLLNNFEWTRALTAMSATLRRDKANQSVMSELRSENVRAFYEEQTLQTP